MKQSKTVTLTWHGTAAFEVACAGKTLLIDPFVSRPSLARVALGMRLDRDEREIEHRFPKADYILIGHSHFDHLMDAPSIALRTGASIIGSPTACHLARSLGIHPRSLVPQADPPQAFRRGPFDIRLVPSLHGRVVLGRVPYNGYLESVPAKRPAKASDYPVGHVYGILLRAGGISFYHNGSAGLIDEELRGKKADVLLLGLAGRFRTKDYTGRMISLLSPRVIIPCHYDYFFSPIGGPLRHLPLIGMGDFIREVHDVDPGIKVLLPGIGDAVRCARHGSEIRITC